MASKAKTAPKGDVEIRLKALGELSPLTGRVMVRKGESIFVSKEDAAEAVASGRWVKVEKEEAEPSGDEGPEGK